MDTPPPAGTPGQEARTLLNSLQEKFQVFRDYSPLAIGIDKQVLEQLPDLNRKALRVALGMHTHSHRYLKTMEKASHRFNLNGEAGDEIAEEHRKHAAETLRERFRKDAERRKAQREAEQREQQRTAKLNQLVEKFGKSR